MNFRLSGDDLLMKMFFLRIAPFCSGFVFVSKNMKEIVAFRKNMVYSLCRLTFLA